MKNPLKKTTEEGVETEISVQSSETVVKINVMLHPKDVDKLHDVIDEFLINGCDKTNEFVDDMRFEEAERLRNKFF